MESQITFELSDNPIQSIFNYHKGIYDFAFALFEFYQEKHNQAVSEGKDQKEIKNLEETTTLWAHAANLNRAPVMAMTIGDRDSMMELVSFIMKFNDKLVEKMKEKLKEKGFDVSSLSNV
jgi:hypothetical protein